MWPSPLSDDCWDLSRHASCNLEQYFLERSILCPRNVDVDEFNTRLLDSFSGEERVYHSADFADEDGQGIQYPTEYLQSIDIPASPHTNSS